MPLTTQHLDIHVLVRRIGIGANPFTWEIQGTNSLAAKCVSSKRYASMEAAYVVGQATLAEFLRSLSTERRQTTAPEASRFDTMNKQDWRTEVHDLDEIDQDEEFADCDEPIWAQEAATI